jgi:hypothetical protein
MAGSVDWIRCGLTCFCPGRGSVRRSPIISRSPTNATLEKWNFEIFKVHLLNLSGND